MVGVVVRIRLGYRLCSYGIVVAFLLGTPASKHQCFGNIGTAMHRTVQAALRVSLGSLVRRSVVVSQNLEKLGSFLSAGVQT
jgi:hypothetical protein